MGKSWWNMADGVILWPNFVLNPNLKKKMSKNDPLPPYMAIFQNGRHFPHKNTNIRKFWLSNDKQCWFLWQSTCFWVQYFQIWWKQNSNCIQYGWNPIWPPFFIKISEMQYKKNYVKKSYLCIGLIFLPCIVCMYAEMPAGFQDPAWPLAWSNPRWPPLFGN